MAHQFEIFFNNGSLWAAHPDGPALAGGQILDEDNNPVLAYRFLYSMDGVERGFVVQQTRLLDRPAQISFRGCALRVINSLILNPARSDFRANVPQVQTYEGPLLLSWEARNLVAPAALRPFVPWHGQPGHTEINGSIVLTYPPRPNADIAGTGSGQFMRPGFPGANRAASATFGSAVPARPNEFKSEFQIANFVLRGTWTPRVQLRLPPGVRIPPLPRR